MMPVIFCNRIPEPLMCNFMSYKIFGLALPRNRILRIKYTSGVLQSSEYSFGLNVCQFFVWIRSYERTIKCQRFHCNRIVIKSFFSVFCKDPGPDWYAIDIAFKPGGKRGSSKSHYFCSQRNIFFPVCKFSMPWHATLLNKISASDNFIVIGRSYNKIDSCFIVWLVKTWKEVTCPVRPVISKKSTVPKFIL